MAIIHTSLVTAEDAVLDAGTRLNGALLDFYSGSMPVSVDTAISSQVLLATLQFGSPAFTYGTVDGLATATAITPDGAADASGTATWCRIRVASVARYDVDVSDTAGTGAIKFTNNLFATGAPVTMSSFTLSAPVQ